MPNWTLIKIDPCYVIGTAIEHEDLVQEERFAAIFYKPSSCLCLQPEFLLPNLTTRLFLISSFKKCHEAKFKVWKTQVE
jgi:hypothetical protein